MSKAFLEVAKSKMSGALPSRFWFAGGTPLSGVTLSLSRSAQHQDHHLGISTVTWSVERVSEAKEDRERRERERCLEMTGTLTTQCFAVRG